MEPYSSWKHPQKTEKSYITGLQVSNSLSPGKLVDFIPQNGRRVTWYMCGPTVYDHSHLGHARTYLAFDMIRKVMKYYFNYDVMLCMNITNIDDKIIIRSNELGEDFEKFANKWENDYFEDMKKLGVELPEAITRVSEYVDDIVEFIAKIINRGYAYESNGSVYFDVLAYQKSTHVYGKLAPSSVGDAEKLKEGEGALTGGETEKRSPFDFALWKKSKPGEPKWKSPWGEGRPGWHIECSAMANAILGSPVDIHSGGIDLKFPHHENEIAQSEAFYDNEQWINYFIHSGHLNIDGLKMSKSLKNFIKIKTMIEKYSARQIRLLFLMHKYDSLMDYMPAAEELDPEFLVQNPKYRGTKGSMGQVMDVDRKYAEFFLNVKANLRQNPITNSQMWQTKEFNLNTVLAEKKAAIHKHLCNNFDTPSVLYELDQIISATNTYISQPGIKYPLVFSVATYVSTIFRCIGLNYDDKFTASDDKTTANVEEIVAPYLDVLSKFRDDVRSAAKSQNPTEVLKACDVIRDDILPYLGVRLEDKSPGVPSIWKFDDKDKLIAEREAKIAEKEKNEAEKKKKLEEKLKKEAELEVQSKIHPGEMFKNQTDLYSQFDEKSIPTHDKEGNELSKGKRKQLVKDYEKQEKLHNQWLEKNKDKKEL